VACPVPGKRLLPIMAVPTEMEALPGYLRSVTILKPAGDLVADTVSQTARIAVRLQRGDDLSVESDEE